MPAPMEYGLLGPLTVRSGGTPVPVPPGKQQVVLAALLLRAGRLVEVAELNTALWGLAPPASARVSLQNYVSRLRRVLGADGPAIVTEPGGYRIEVAPAELDVTRFEAAVTAGRAAARDGDWAGAARLLRQALALWRGQPLLDVPSEDLAAREVPRLAELRWQALETRIGADLRLGRHADVLGELRALVGEQPLRERLHALLMLALYQDGQPAAALAAYQAAADVLAAELGAQPGAELRRLRGQVLAGDPALGRPSGSDQAPVAGTPPAAAGMRYSLPPDTAAFTGRRGELDRITASVTSAAEAGGVVAIRAIDGMPGIGKTALAIHAAHLLRGRFPDRQLFIDLHGHTPGQDPAQAAAVLSGLLAAVGVEPGSMPPGLDARVALWRDKMAGQRAVLVLDNAASSAQVAPLLPGTDGCLVLVTSRRHLADLPGAVTGVLLDTLPPDQAARMLTRLAPRAAASPPAEVARLAELAGFLPLAISLLARVLNRHRSWSLADLAAETGSRLLTMAAEADSVAAAFDISYRHLDPGEQRFFRLLGLHPGATVDAFAAAALAGVPVAAAAGLLDRLHGEGLLTETGYRRYGMHDLIRRFAAERAAADPAAARQLAMARLLDYYQHASARADAVLSRQPFPAAVPAAVSAAELPPLADAGAAQAWTRAERATLLACLSHAAAAGDNARLVELTAAMAAQFRQDGPWAEAATWHAAAAAAARQLGDRAGEAAALNNLGAIRHLTGDFPAARETLRQALAIFREIGDQRGQVSALGDLGIVAQFTGDYPTAVADFSEALAIARELGDRHGQARALLYRGEALQLTGDYPAAVADLGAALDTFRDLGDRRGQGAALMYRGALEYTTGDYPAASADLAEALAIFREIGFRLGQAGALNDLGHVRHLTGDHQVADQLLREALATYRELGIRLGEANVLKNLGAARGGAGDYVAAERHLREALAMYRELGDRGGELEALNEAGLLHEALGDARQAAGYYQQALDVAGQLASPRDEGRARAGLGRCALAVGDTAAAVAALREAAAILTRIGAPEAGAVAADLAALAGRDSLGT